MDYVRGLFKCHPDYLYSVHADIDEYSKEYFLAIDNEYCSISIAMKRCCFSCIDYHAQYHNIDNGLRRTTGSPQKFNHRIFLLGSSYTFGSRVADKYTIASYLQKHCNDLLQNHWCILNLGVLGGMIQNSWLQCRYLLPTIGLSPGDTVIIILHKNDFMKDYTRYYFDLYNYFKGIHVDLFILMWPRINELIFPSPLERTLATYSYEELYNHMKYQNLSLPFQRKYNPHDNSVDKSWIDVLSFDCCYDLQTAFDRPHTYGEIFIDKTHISPAGNQLVADFIFQNLIKNMKLNRTNEMSCNHFDEHHNFEELETEALQWLQKELPLRAKLSNNNGLTSWLKTITRFDSGLVNDLKIGCIVMNCNPMTLGHVYCIYKSLEIVECLYLFVVKEDKSTFPFSDRFNIVKTVCVREFKDRVRVVPSGEFIISSFSFPGYFTKETQKLSVRDRDASFDIAIFGSMIAPALNITYCFVGEEPLCPVTQEYNELMLKILPPMGVNVHIFRRKQSGGLPVSASRVRDLVSVKDFNAIRSIVPYETYEYVLKRELSPFHIARIIVCFRHIMRWLFSIRSS